MSRAYAVAASVLRRSSPRPTDRPRRGGPLSQVPSPRESGAGAYLGDPSAWPVVAPEDLAALGSTPGPQPGTALGDAALAAAKAAAVEHEFAAGVASGLVAPLPSRVDVYAPASPGSSMEAAAGGAPETVVSLAPEWRNALLAAIAGALLARLL